MATDILETVVEIVASNTDTRMQTETVPISRVKQIAKYANIPSADTEDAIKRALEDGRLEEIDGQLKLVDF
ncbi:hypothetical protein [Natronorubrum halophilum]|uniref:hypothetical protein n=1 Tax=Natronorubrum halophilum TaxID=1702106 RepID=UPI000EF75588|nr:hypothetical protein [Natronorubrum halophilum]